MLLTGGYRSTRSSTCPTATLCTINLAWTARGIEKWVCAGTCRRLNASAEARLACSMPRTVQNCSCLTSQLSENTFCLNYKYGGQLHKRLCAKCPHVSPQSVSMSPLKVPICLRPKCSHFSAQCPHVSTQSFRMSLCSVRMSPHKVFVCLRAVPACLRAKCPHDSAQSVRLSPRKVSVCLCAKCSHVSAQSIRLFPRKVPACLRAKCLYIFARSVRMSSCKVSVPFVHLNAKSHSVHKFY